MNNSTNLLTIEVGSGCDVAEYDFYETSSASENTQNEEVIVISGTLTVSF
ncbi:MAG: hypothetical protein WAM28_04515 [Chlamydiales bacterium]